MSHLAGFPLSSFLPTNRPIDRLVAGICQSEKVVKSVISGRFLVNSGSFLATFRPVLAIQVALSRHRNYIPMDAPTMPGMALFTGTGHCERGSRNTIISLCTSEIPDGFAWNYALSDRLQGVKRRQNHSLPDLACRIRRGF